MPKVSVIIPTWNRAGFITRAIESVLVQTEQSLEVLVCDDGSTDNTHQIVAAINDSRVKWIEGPRGGRPAIPRNRGIAASKGEWLAFLDSDDEWLPDKLAKQLDTAERRGCQVVSTNALRFVPGSGITGNLLSSNKDTITFTDLLRVNEVICSSVLLRRSLFDIIFGFPEEARANGVEDYSCWLRAATQTDIAYISEPLLVYRDDSANSVRGSVSSDIWLQRQNAFRDVLNWTRKQKINDALLASAKRSYYGALWQRNKALVRDFLGRVKGQ